MLKEISDLVSTPAKAALRIIAVALLVVLLVSQFPWMNSLVGRLLNFSDLRHRISLDETSESGLSSVRFEVVNQGFGKAENVVVHICAPGSNVTLDGVDSQELYEIRNTDPQRGVIDILLDRLTAGASIQVELTGVGFVTDTLSLSAASDQGSSISIDSPGFSDYVKNTTELFSEAGRIVWEAPPVQELKRQASNTSGVSDLLLAFQNYEFQRVALAALIVIIVIVLFLPDEYMLLIPFILGFVVWLFFEIPTPGGEQIVCGSAFALVLMIMAVIGLAIEQSNPSKRSDSQATPEKIESTRIVVAQYERKIAKMEQALAEKEDQLKALLGILESLLRQKDQFAGIETKAVSQGED
jgi:hypothetical protein